MLLRRLPQLLLCALLLPPFAAASSSAADLDIDRDTTLDPGKTYGRIVIKASNVTVDGRGAWLIGAKEGDAKSFQGTAIAAEGVDNVTLKNVNAKGWETGLHLKTAKGWAVENCNFSDNFHDPGFGWGENGRRGGIVLEGVTKSTLRKNRANRVWDACVLVASDDNLLEDNDFSRTSNTCLKLWNASRNKVRRNNLSYGIRIDPGEVHARDSTCVLIESGSNDNHFAGNDCTHGGDGIFVRVLNQWVSTGNRFENNDCSYANNNCVEAWSPRNTWIGNKANHGSYGFWLGASDQNVLIGNEASHNGLASGFHNSPHLPGDGHAGIVFMFGPSSHTLLRGNTCEGNNGAGIAAIGDLDSKGQKWNAFHWVIEQNKLSGNRWGIFLQHAEMIDLAANEFKGNKLGDVHQEANVTALVEHPSRPEIKEPPVAKLAGPLVARVDEEAVFDASASSDPARLPLSFRWRISGGPAGEGERFLQRLSTPGYYRLALTVNNGLFSDLAWRDLYVIDEAAELGTEATPQSWSWTDPGSQVKFAADKDAKLVGQSSLRANITPYSGGRVTLRFAPDKALDLAGKTKLTFWLKTRNESTPAWQDLNPLVAILGEGKSRLDLVPARDFLSDPPYNEAREGWTYFSIPLAGDARWKASGELPPTAAELHFGFDSWNAPPLTVWIDGLGLR
jgi:parallel beta-helix repeat protein